MVSTWMGDRLGTPCAVDIQILFPSFKRISSLYYFQKSKTSYNNYLYNGIEFKVSVVSTSENFYSGLEQVTNTCRIKHISIPISPGYS